MLRSLQNRLILSHLLPLFIIIPLTGIAFIYVLETQVILPNLANSLVIEGELLAKITIQNPDLLESQAGLTDLMNQMKTSSNARVMFLDPDARLLASNDPSDKALVGSIVSDDDVPKALNGEIVQHIEFSNSLQREVVDVFVPVVNLDDDLIGIIRLSHPYATIFEELKQMRLIILGIMVFALAAGVSLGVVLAVTINTPIKQVTAVIDQLAKGDKLEEVDQQGPEEIQSLIHSTNAMSRRLHDLEKARKQLLANLVHEIGRPLGALRSALQSLKLGAMKDPQLVNDLTEGMDAEADRLQHLLDELAHMHDQIFGTLELDRQRISVKPWLHTLLRPWQEAAKAKGLRWKTEIPDDLADLNADPYRLAQAIENLVSNAIKYTPFDESVTISVYSNDKSIEFVVKDTGSGIDPDEQRNIFSPFYRGDQTRRIKQGMGLGLSIAKDIVLAHGGEIDLESRLGEGSNFIITIPFK